MNKKKHGTPPRPIEEHKARLKSLEAELEQLYLIRNRERTAKQLKRVLMLRNYVYRQRNRIETGKWI
jgi:hypothetical protein